QRAIDFRRADADAMAIQSRIRAAEHEAAATIVHPEEIPMAPDARVFAEVGIQIALVVRVVPKTHRHRGHGLGYGELADLVDDLLAALVKGIDRAPQRTHLDLSGVHRQGRRAYHEPRTNIGATAAGGHPHVLLDVLVDPLHAFRRDGRPGE